MINISRAAAQSDTSRNGFRIRPITTNREIRRMLEWLKVLSVNYVMKFNIV